MTKSYMRVPVLAMLLATVLATGSTAEQAASPTAQRHAVVATSTGPTIVSTAGAAQD